MRVTRFVQTLGLLLVLGLVGTAGGCGPGSGGPVDQEHENQIKESKKTGHRQIQEGQKAQAGATQQDTSRKAAHRGRPGQ